MVDKRSLIRLGLQSGESVDVAPGTMSDPRKTPEWRILECIHNTKSYQPHTKRETAKPERGEERQEGAEDRQGDGATQERAGG